MTLENVGKSDPWPLLDRWVLDEHIRPVDRAFALFLAEQEPDAPSVLIIAAALAAFYTGQGHSCLDVRSVAGSSSLVPFVEQLRYPPLTDPGSNAPLALVETPVPRLYLRRYYRYEQTIYRHVTQRVTADLNVNEIETRRVLDTLFNTTESDNNPWPRIACSLAMRTRFSVITGGPGTGKTTTVVRLLAAISLLEGSIRIRLAAPTGKAAGRLQESIEQQRVSIPAEVRETIPRVVTTIHRLLKIRGTGRRTPFDETRTLPVDLVVIDEGSMMDVELTAMLLRALPAHARLILLGDKDQLASVDAGAILADFCARAEGGHYTPAIGRWIKETTGADLPTAMIDPEGKALDQTITMLRVSYRFSATGGIGKPAETIRRGKADELPGPSPADSDEQFRRFAVADPNDARLREVVMEYRNFTGFLHDSTSSHGDDREERDRWAREVLLRFNRFRVLCVVREGPWGVRQMNELVERTLVTRGEIPEESDWYAGRPVLVTRNDYNLNLMNGEIGIVLPTSDGLRVAFDAGIQGIRWVLPGRLHAIETVFAMTVHKSQGSEFDHVVLVLPERDVPVLTRELVYTAVTRARHRVTVVEKAAALLETAATRRVERTGGLADLLHGVYAREKMGEEGFEPPTSCL